jgi:hypothetical protein
MRTKAFSGPHKRKFNGNDAEGHISPAENADAILRRQCQDGYAERLRAAGYRFGEDEAEK